MIILLTDFGLEDAYVGVMKGVIKKIDERIGILDLCHFISPQNIIHAQVVLQDSYAWFPEDSVFCCVVDPGVGSSRRAIVVEYGGYCFVEPDNGLFTFALLDNEARAYELPENPDSSTTFHGRDVFAPFAASLECDRRILKRLNPVENYNCKVLEVPEPEKTAENELKGQVLYADHFGNLITNIRENDLAGHEAEFYFQWSKLSLCRNYMELPESAAGVIKGSSGRLEIARKNASAESFFRPYSQEVLVKWKKQERGGK
jgi:S-adenosylmethionine hydrolase